MPNRILLHAAENKRLEAVATKSSVMRPIVNRYVGGQQVEDAWRATAALNAKGIDASLDLLGESVSDARQAEIATQAYEDAIEAASTRAPSSTVSVKLSQLGILIDRKRCADNLLRLLEASQKFGVQVEVDMEQSSVGRTILAIFKEIVADFPATRIAMQACMRQTPYDLRAFSPTLPKIRLVKGAFEESVNVALRTPSEVTAQYNFLARWAMENLPDPAFGTHDDRCIQTVKEAAAKCGRGKQEFEFQMLYGVRRSLQARLVQEGYRVRVYLPFGTQWYPYLMRRMAERPANLLLFLRSVVGD